MVVTDLFRIDRHVLIIQHLCHPILTILDSSVLIHWWTGLEKLQFMDLKISHTTVHKLPSPLITSLISICCSFNPKMPLSKFSYSYSLSMYIRRRFCVIEAACVFFFRAAFSSELSTREIWKRDVTHQPLSERRRRGLERWRRQSEQFAH